MESEHVPNAKYNEWRVRVIYIYIDRDEKKKNN